MKLVLREDAVHTGLGTEAPWLIAVASQLHLGTTAPQISLHSFSFVRFPEITPTFGGFTARAAEGIQ